MNGDSPCQSQGQLLKRTLHLALYLSRLLVQRIACVLPHLWFHLYSLTVALTIYGQSLLARLRHSSYAPIIILMLARRIVLHKHHLRTLLQHQRLGCGVRVFRKSTLHLSMILVGSTRQLLQFRFVVEVSQIVVRSQADIRLFGARHKCRLATTVQPLDSLCRWAPLTYLVQ